MFQLTENNSVLWCWAWKTPAFTFLQDSTSQQRNSWECSQEHDSTGKNLLIVFWKPFSYTGRECRVHLKRNVCAWSITLSVRIHRGLTLWKTLCSQFTRYQIPTSDSLSDILAVHMKKVGRPLFTLLNMHEVHEYLLRHMLCRSSKPSEPKLQQARRERLLHSGTLTQDRRHKCNKMFCLSIFCHPLLASSSLVAL